MPKGPSRPAKGRAESPQKNSSQRGLKRHKDKSKISCGKARDGKDKWKFRCSYLHRMIDRHTEGPSEVKQQHAHTLETIKGQHKQGKKQCLILFMVCMHIEGLIWDAKFEGDQIMHFRVVPTVEAKFMKSFKKMMDVVDEASLEKATLEASAAVQIPADSGVPVTSTDAGTSVGSEVPTTSTDTGIPAGSAAVEISADSEKVGEHEAEDMEVGIIKDFFLYAGIRADCFTDRTTIIKAPWMKAVLGEKDFFFFRWTLEKPR